MTPIMLTIAYKRVHALEDGITLALCSDCTIREVV